MATEGASNTTEGIKKLLGASVEESRVKRLEKQHARYRDRGGIFVPADTNPLLDVLLARGVNGESPTKKRRARSRTSSPVKRKKAEPKPADNHALAPTDSDNVENVAVAGHKPEGGTKVAAASGKRLAKTVKTTRLAKGEKKSTRTKEKELPAGTSRHTQDGARKAKSITRRTKPKLPANDVSLVDDDDDMPLRGVQRQESAPQPRIIKTTKPPEETRSKGRGASEREAQHSGPKAPDKTATKQTVKPTVKLSGTVKDAASFSHNDMIVNDEKGPQARERKGRVKDKDETLPESGASTGGISRLSNRTKVSSSRKRSSTVIESESGPPMTVNSQPNPVRKRPKIPLPSDSEDDLPLVLQMAVKHKVGTDRDARPHITTDSIAAKATAAESIPGAPSRSTLSSVKPRRHIVKGATAPPDVANENDAPPSIQNSIGANHSQLANGSKADSRRLDEHDANRTKSEKHNGGQTADRPRKPTKSTHQAAKRKKPAPVALEAKDDVARGEPPTKRLKTTSSDKKENRRKAKNAVISRKPKPRLSLFPTPAMAMDSDDELDLLQ